MVSLQLWVLVPVRRGGFGVPRCPACVGKSFWEMVHPSRAVSSSRARSSCLYSPGMGTSPRRLIKPGGQFIEVLLEVRGQELTELSGREWGYRWGRDGNRWGDAVKAAAQRASVLLSHLLMQSTGKRSLPVRNKQKEKGKKKEREIK